MENSNHSEWLLVADGEPVTAHTLSSLAKNKRVMILDGAYEYVKKTNIHIDIVLGDFDSIDASDLSYLRNDTCVEIVEAPNQNKTDLEKGLEYIDSLNPSCIYIVAAIGRRLQHTLYNLRLLKRYHQTSRPLILISEREIIHYYQDTKIMINGQPNDSIGILGFPEAVITTKGLQYDVTDYQLKFEYQNSICNALTGKQAEIEIKGGVLLLHETHLRIP